MSTRSRKTLILGLVCLLPTLASAAPILPGLWEVSTDKMEVDGKAMPGMEEMFKKVKQMPDEQRKVMEDMMKRQGVRLGEKGIQVCMSEEQVNANHLPLLDTNSGCSQNITERTDKVWKFEYLCPNTRGEGETHFASKKAFTTKVKTHFQTENGEKDGSIESSARWVGADCDTLAPR
ncbi:DUF3617 domain-containing protein [Pseudomonas marincola]|uniref:DUF3617 domain-containing protein n=1 Tax=Pseudomonas marincola TaxID=437900 RepID=UPI0008EDF0CE|nr:DUF3617 domain-containing protein [Pseudomonas marincola]SFT96669.1 Protein of unknown function [Pseudomonas marincola]